MSHRTFNDPNSIEARQALLDNRCEHAPKRHRTKPRTKRLAAAKRARIKHTLATQEAAQRRHHAAVRAYWTGETDTHPEQG